MEKAGPFDCCCNIQSVTRLPSLGLCQAQNVVVDILSTFCGVFMVRCNADVNF